MSCDKDIHKAIIEMGELICPFCNQEIAVSNPLGTKECCDKMEIINDRGEIVCRKCGQIHEYSNSPEYIDFHENKYKIRRKSVYHRKYHVEKVIYEVNIKLSYNNREKIYKVFNEIQKIVPLIDAKRKRMISINFLIRQILKYYFADPQYRKIKITTSDKTLQYYKKYWNSIIEMIGDKIKSILGGSPKK